MSGRTHRYQAHLTWTGNKGAGTSGYAVYGRDHKLESEGKPSIIASSDPNFRGDAARWNPEELLVASLSSCHQLWYLHLCSVNGVVVTAYEDMAEGWMAENADGSGEFTRVLLKPRVVISSGDPAVAEHLHHEAHKKCFIARSVNFPVECAPTIETEDLRHG